MGKTAYLTSPCFARHDTGASHPERAARLAAIARRLEGSGLLAELEREDAPDATRAALVRVHDPAHVARVEAAIARGARVLDEGDTRVSADSFRAALAAAGGAVRAVDLVLDGAADHAFVGARPPGHHAERGEAMGFCLFNNAAVAAAHLRQARGLSRVAILDWDVHHGNGTQHLFEEDPTVFYASLHQWPLYPGTGGADEQSETLLNIPLRPGTGDEGYSEAWSAVERAVLRFAPDLLLVSAGFDAHIDDPLAGMEVTADGFADLARRSSTLAPRVAAVLEGGYNLRTLPDLVGAALDGFNGAETRKRPAR